MGMDRKRKEWAERAAAGYGDGSRKSRLTMDGMMNQALREGGEDAARYMSDADAALEEATRVVRRAAGK